jgi:hypothetical protein
MVCEFREGCCQRFGGLRSGGVKGRKFNESTQS